MISHRKQIRRWAARMLLVWLFGVFAGVANACVLGSPSEHPAGAAVVEYSASHSQHGDSADETSCQEFCALASAAVPSKAAALDKVAFSAIPIGFATTAFAVAPSLWLPPFRPLRRSSAPPIPIEFLRLAL